MSDEKIIKPGSIIPPEFHQNAGPGGEKHRHEEQGKDKERDKPVEEVKEHYDEFSRLMDEANARLEHDASPFRFRLRHDGAEIIIDLVRLDENGHDSSVLYRNITHQAFYTAAEHVVEGHGLVLDLIG